MWGPPAPAPGPHLPRPNLLEEPLPVRSPGAHSSPEATMQTSGGAAAAEHTRIGSAGPLLVFPDTRWAHFYARPHCHCRMCDLLMFALKCASPLHLHCCPSHQQFDQLNWPFALLQRFLGNAGRTAGLEILLLHIGFDAGAPARFPHQCIPLMLLGAMTRWDGCGDLTWGSPGVPGAGAKPQIRTRSAAIRADFHSADRLSAETAGRLEGPASTCCRDSRISGARPGHLRPCRCAAAAPPPGSRRATLRCHHLGCRTSSN